MGYKVCNENKMIFKLIIYYHLNYKMKIIINMKNGTVLSN